MSIFVVIAMLTSIEVWGSIKVIRGQLRVMRGHIIKNSKMFATYDILRCSAFFEIHHAYVPNCFEVIRGQFRSSWGQSFHLLLVWTYFHYNTAVFSFQQAYIQLIFNVSIFKVQKGHERSYGQEQIKKGCHKWYPWELSFLLIYLHNADVSKR